MASSESKLIVQTRDHPIGLIVVPFAVGEFYNLLLILNTGFVISALTPGVRDSLEALGHLQHTAGRFYQLHDLRLGGRPVPPLTVRVNIAIATLGVEGIVGLNFLNQFREIHFDVESRVLTPTFPQHEDGPPEADERSCMRAPPASRRTPCIAPARPVT